MGGASVMNCEALQIKNVEYPYPELSADGIKKAILNYKFLKEDEANFDVKVIDTRVDDTVDKESYHDKRDREAKEFKDAREQKTAHM